LWEIHAIVSEHVNASPDRVRALYEDPTNWARLFPATIRGAHAVRREGNTTVIDVDHVEGRVINILRYVSSTRIDLAEFKRRYEATFVNEFIRRWRGHALQAHGHGSPEVALPSRGAVSEAFNGRENAASCRGGDQGGRRSRAVEQRWRGCT
jgi:hypothetical protein